MIQVRETNGKGMEREWKGNGEGMEKVTLNCTQIFEISPLSCFSMIKLGEWEREWKRNGKGMEREWKGELERGIWTPNFILIFKVGPL